MATSSGLDYVALRQTSNEIIVSLGGLQISPWRVRSLPKPTRIIGGFGDVEKARLMGTRWRVWSSSLVAVKRLRPVGDYNQRTRVVAAVARELDVWSRLDHKNILPLTGFYIDQSALESAWIVTPWQATGNVSDFIAATKPDQARRLQLALDTARAVSYLHSLSPPVCHADIKAENTLIDDHGNALLCDFGLAKIVQETPTGLTTTKSTKYTSRYAAPELITIDGAAHTLASDVWAWGCLLLVILTDLLPYGAKVSDNSIIYAIHQMEPPVDLPALVVSDFILLILESCWEVKPESRRSIDWCERLLVDQPPIRPFSNFTEAPFSRVPLRIKTGNKNVEIVCNPHSTFTHEVELVPSPRETKVRNYHWQFTPDGRYVATWYNKDVTMYDATTGHRQSILRVMEFPPPSAGSALPLQRIAFSADGSIMAVELGEGGDSEVIQVWDLASEQFSFELSGLLDPISSLAFANADRILVGTSRTKVRSWDAHTGEALQTIYFSEFVRCISCSTHNPLVVVSLKDGLQVINVRTGQILLLQPNMKSTSFVLDGNRLFAIGEEMEESTLRVCDLRPVLERWQGDEMSSIAGDSALELPWRPLEGPQTGPYEMSVSSDGRVGLFEPGKYETRNNSCFLWDLVSQEPLMMIRRIGGAWRNTSQIQLWPGSTHFEGRIAFDIPDETGNRTGGLQIINYRRRL